MVPHGRDCPSRIVPHDTNPWKESGRARPKISIPFHGHVGRDCDAVNITSEPYSVESTADNGFRKHQRLWAAAQGMTMVALALIGIKPLLDIPGEKIPQDTVDAGLIGTAIGAMLMIVALVVVSVLRRRLPARLLPGLVALLILGLLSAVSLFLVSTRDDFLQIFTVTGLRDIFGPYIPPRNGIITQAAQFGSGFAPVALLALVLIKPDWFSLRRIRWVLWAVLIGTLAHSVIAWLQVAGLVPYTFFFRLPGGDLGRASGGYFHPASLGRLLIFAAFIIYAARHELRVKALWRYVMLAVVVATAVVTTHRVTIFSVALIVLVFEARRFRLLLHQLSNLRFRTAVWAAAALVGVVVLVLLRWGSQLWDRALFLVSHVGSLNITSRDFLRGRGEIWFEYVRAWTEARPDVWIFGLGYEPWNTHNDLLRIFVVWGVVGLALMTLVFTNVWRVTRQAISKEARWMLLLVYIVAIPSVFMQRPTAYPYFMWLFFLVHALLIVAYRNVDPASAGGELTKGDDQS